MTTLQEKVADAIQNVTLEGYNQSYHEPNPVTFYVDDKTAENMAKAAIGTVREALLSEAVLKQVFHNIEQAYNDGYIESVIVLKTINTAFDAAEIV